MWALRPKVFAILLLCFCINIVIAGRVQRRDGPTTPSVTAAGTTASNSLSASPSPSNKASPSSGQTSANNDDKSSTSSSKSSEGTKSSVTSSASSSRSSTSSSTTRSGDIVTATPSNTASASILNDGPYNFTLTPNLLPIEPRVTPGVGVIGIILLLTGAVYTVVGIKNKLLHVFLSAAYLSALSVTVLILFVMNLPVSNAVQGAYVVAAAITGLILGAAASVFTEMTEGLGCLLGGFCLSMWLLILKPGGLLTSTSSKAIFIASFTAAGYSASFSHYTRPYGLIGGISFAGSTVIVLGIDCFSRAGLKEFWAYLWALNDNLFPLGATSYPITRGIKVEIAVIVVLTLVGILSQMKLWKVIRERREKRTAEKVEDGRSLAREEETVGRRVEVLNAQERNQWETVYGDKDRAPQSSDVSERDSGVGDMESQKKGLTSVVTYIGSPGDDEIEMSNMPKQVPWKPAGLLMTNRGQDNGPVTVRVARDFKSEPELYGNKAPVESSSRQRQSHISTADEETTGAVGVDGEMHMQEQKRSRRQSKRSSNPPQSVQDSGVPNIVPLPFKVPEGDEEENGSSVATFADEERAVQGKSPYLKHMSAGSKLIRRLSGRSMMSPSPRSSRRFSSNDGPSTEDLVVRHEVEDDRRSSVAATMDGLSDDDDLRSIRSSMDYAPGTNGTTTLTVNAASEEEGNGQTAISILEATPEEEATTKTLDKTKKAGAGGTKKSLTSSTDPKVEPEATEGTSEVDEMEPKTPRTGRSRSIVSVGSRSRQPSLTAAALPPALSKVVMSYRTNEWAKHLSHADAPEFEALKMEEYPAETEEAIIEPPVPVNVEELQKTAENAIPPPAPRTAPLTRPDTSQSKSAAPYASVVDASPGRPSLEIIPSQNISQQSIPSSARRRLSAGPVVLQPTVKPPMENFSYPAPSTVYQNPSPNVPFGSTNTLMGQRESMVKNKTFYGSTPDLSRNFPPQTYQNFPPQVHGNYKSMPGSRIGSDVGSIYTGRNSMSNPASNEIDDDNISLSHRRDLIRQSSLQQIGPPVALFHNSAVAFDSHQPKRVSSIPTQGIREQQMASWRASVQHELDNGSVPKRDIEKKRNMLWQERQAEEQRRAMDARMKGQRESAFDERMRNGDMLEAHREAMRRMQASANKNV